MRNDLIEQQNQDFQIQRFSEEDARYLVEDMILTYGKKFIDQWKGLNKKQVIAKFVEKLADLNQAQFRRGLKRLETAEWPPAINEFKNWCIGGYEYQTADDAWLQALDYEKNNRVAKINLFARNAFEEVCKAYGYFGSTDTFYKVFSSVYKRLITDAKEQKIEDQVLDAISQVESKGEEFNHNPISNAEAQKHLEALKQKMNVRNRHIHKPQELKPKAKPLNTPIINEWPDPFEQPDAYLKQCELDGCVVPATIRKQLGGRHV